MFGSQVIIFCMFGRLVDGHPETNLEREVPPMLHGGRRAMVSCCGWSSATHQAGLFNTMVVTCDVTSTFFIISQLCIDRTELPNRQETHSPIGGAEVERK